MICPNTNCSDGIARIGKATICGRGIFRSLLMNADNNVIADRNVSNSLPKVVHGSLWMGSNHANSKNIAERM